MSGPICDNCGETPTGPGAWMIGEWQVCPKCLADPERQGWSPLEWELYLNAGEEDD